MVNATRLKAKRVISWDLRSHTDPRIDVFVLNKYTRSFINSQIALICILNLNIEYV